MSNKTQLQTNNTALDSLISRVNAAKDVAASLPDAGGSGGGNSNIKNVNVTGNFDYDHLWYSKLDENTQTISYIFDECTYDGTVPLSVLNNSLLIILDGTAAHTFEGAQVTGASDSFWIDGYYFGRACVIIKIGTSDTDIQITKILEGA